MAMTDVLLLSEGSANASNLALSVSTSLRKGLLTFFVKAFAMMNSGMMEVQLLFLACAVVRAVSALSST